MSLIQTVTVSLITLLLEHMARLKLRRKPDEEPEAIQGKPVDRVLYHLVTDAQCPWDAGESWEKHGRGHIVALERQGLDDMLDERAVEDYKAAYTLGYCVREEADRKEIARLTKQLKRREETIRDLRNERNQLEEQLQGNDDLLDRFSVAESSRAGLEARCRQLLRELQAEREKVEALTSVPADNTEPASEPTPSSSPDYAALSGEDKIAAMVSLKDSGQTYAQIAELFGMTEGGVKGQISKARKGKKKTDRVVEIDFTGVSNGVSVGV